ncbi:MAG TPA: hypothetical protein VGO93_06280, partial [Candidatus Xenobia bacterium]
MTLRLWPLALLTLAVVVPPVAAAPPKKPAVKKPVAKKKPSQSSLVLDGQGAGVLKFWDVSKDRTAGHFSMASWFQDGLAVLATDLMLPAKNRGWDAAGYFEASANALSTLGSLHVPLEKDWAPRFDVTGSMHQDGTHFTINGKLTSSFSDLKQVPLKTIAVDGQNTIVGWDQMESHLHVLSNGDAIAQEVVPAFSSMDLHLSQADDLTTVVFTASMPPASPIADPFKKMATNAADFEQKALQGLKEQGLDVQSVKVSDAVASDQQVSATVTVVVKGFREFLRTRGEALYQNMRGQSSEAVGNGLKDMTGVELSDFHFHGEAHDKELDGTLDLKVGHATRLVLGYLEVYEGLLGWIQSMDKSHHPSKFAQYTMRVATDSLEQLRPAIEQVAGKVSDSQTSSFTLQYQHGEQGDTIDGSMDMTGDTAGLRQALLDQHIATLDRQDVQLSLVSDTTAVNGRWSSVSNGPLVDAFK